jgi:hypothetical protein
VEDQGQSTSIRDSSFVQSDPAATFPCVTLAGGGSISHSTIDASFGLLLSQSESSEVAVTATDVGVELTNDSSMERSIVRSDGSLAVQMRRGATLRDSVAFASGAGNAIEAEADLPDRTSTLRNVTAVATTGTALRAKAGDDQRSERGARVDARNVIALGGAGDLDASAAPGCSPTECPSVTITSSNFRTATGLVTDGGGNQSGDPLFANAAAGDFHLLAGSPAIDAGSDDGKLGATDLDGRARTLGAAPDIGAYEVSPSGAPPPGGGGGPGATDTLPPELSGLAVARTEITYVLSEGAAVTLTVQRSRPGRVKRGRCVKPTRKLRRAKRCKRFVRVGALKHAGVEGANALAFSGRIGKRKLRPGRYRIVAIATDAAGNRSLPAKASFRIAKRR